MESSTKKTGGCLCGKIKYQLTGPSATPLYNTVCHCLNCRRVTGSALYTASICPKEGFEITQGEDVMKTFFDKFTDSGRPLRRTFCGDCGSKLFAFTPLREDIVSVAAGSLDDFDEWTPDTEQYCIHRLPFVQKIDTVSLQRRFVEAVHGDKEKE